MSERGGPGKLRSYWEKDIHVVVRRKSAESPVYEVKPEGTAKKRRTLHRNLLLPCDFLPMDSQKTVVAPSPRPSNRRQPELVNPNTNSSELSSDDEDPPEVIVNVHPRNTHPNVSADNQVETENVVETENTVENENVVETENTVENENVVENENAVENENVVENVVETENTVENEVENNNAGEAGNAVDTEVLSELPAQIEQPRARRSRHPPDRLTYYGPGQTDPTNVFYMTATTPPPPFTWPPPLMFPVNTPFPFVHPSPVHWSPFVNTSSPFPHPNIPLPSASHYQPVYGQPAMPYQANWDFNY